MKAIVAVDKFWGIGKNNDLLPTLAGIFCLFVVFLMCLGMLGGGSLRLQALLMPVMAPLANAAESD